MSSFGRHVGSASDLSADEIKTILRRENELRLCEETQILFKRASVQPAGWISVVEELQRRVCREFGLDEDVGLKAMRGANLLGLQARLRKAGINLDQSERHEGPVGSAAAKSPAKMSSFGRHVGSASDLSADEIKTILRRENELRLCEETQILFKRASVQPAGWISVVEELQRRVCREFGLDEDVGLKAMRGANLLLPRDGEVDEISLYRKYNRFRDGPLGVGDVPPDVTVHRLDGEKVSLRALIQGPRPLVMFSGSYT